MLVSQLRADALAKRLELDLDAPLCHACLSFVIFALDRGDARGIASEVRRMTSDLWNEGLAEIALGAVRRAVDAGIPDADAALADLERNGRHSAVARSIVKKLAEEISRRTRTELQVLRLARDRGREERADLN